MKKLLLIITLLTAFTSVQYAQLDDFNNGITGNKIIENGKEFYLYKVQKSEGFYTLERKFGVSRVEIVEYNPELALGLKVGQVVKIPVVKGRNSTESELKEAGEFVYHTVEKGQNLFFISRKYGVTVDDIVAKNPQSREILIPGTELKIPVKPIEPKSINDQFNYHKVNPGETLFSIARSNNTSVKEILEANPGLQSNQVAIGTLIRLPKANESTTEQEKELVPKDSTAYVFEDETYFYHKIKPKETFFSIVNQYHVDKDAVLSANNIANPSSLNIGYIIKIPKSAIIKIDREQKALKDDKHLVYRVSERRESLEDIAQKFAVSIDDLKASNPDYPRWGRFKKGDLVKVPVKNMFTQPIADEVRKQKTLVDHQYVRDSILLAEAFLVGCDTLLNTKTINMAVLWPFFLEANDTFNIVKSIKENGDTIISEKNPLEVYPSPDRLGFREFYEGILLAVDSLKRKGFSINLHTYDTGNDTALVKQILNYPELKQMDFIVGPAYSDNVELVAAFCKRNQIKLVVPYSSVESLTVNNPYVYQINPYKSALYDSAIDFIVKNYKASNIIVAYGGEKSESIQNFISDLKRNLFRIGINQYQPISFKEVDVIKYGFQALEQVIDPEKHNLVVIPPELSSNRRNGLFNRVAPTIENMVIKKRMKNITLFGYPDYQRFSGRELRMVFELNTVLYTPFYVDFEKESTQNVIQLFRNSFYTDPSAEYPYFGLLGFDIAYYFLNAVHEFGSDFERCLPYLKVNLSTSGFDFRRKNNWSGMVNTKVNFLNYKRNFDIKKLEYSPSVNFMELNKLQQ